ncbi:MAG: hypothetical protein OXN44_01070 [Acidimicrobiaceae bacterium]|nr:hypothetical protein [Acidimicrobiaceae bacterium]
MNRRWLPPLIVAPVIVGVSVLGAALPASAHGTGSRTDLPLPAWQMAWAAAFSVIVSFVALGTFWDKPRLVAAAMGRRLVSLASSPAKALEIACKIIGVGLFGMVIFAAWWGKPSAATNIAPTAFLIWFWVGLQLVSVLVGDVYRAFNPYPTIADTAASMKARIRRIPPSPAGDESRDGTGGWVAVGLIAAYLWYELAYHSTDSPRSVAVFLTAYSAVMLGGAAVFGLGWARSADGFAVLFTKISLIAPLYRDQARDLRLRTPLSGLTTLRGGVYTVAFILTVLGSTTFDGFTRSSIWLDLAGDLTGWEATFANTLGLGVIVAFVALLYTLAVKVMAVVTGDSTRELAIEFAPTLVPIVVAYAAAHYFSALMLDGQLLINLLSDPFGHGWDLFGTRDYAINWTLVSPSEIAWVQAVAIAIGHVLAVIAAHDRAIDRYPRETALRSQYPMLLVMVAYTVIGLLLLLGT